jgi:hypothetical protein
MPDNFDWILSVMSPVWYLSLHKSTDKSYLMSLGITTMKRTRASEQRLLQHTLRIRWQWYNCTPPTSSIILSELRTLLLNMLQISKCTTFHKQREQTRRSRTWWWLLYYILYSAGQLWATCLNHTILVMPLSAPMLSVSLFAIQGLPKMMQHHHKGWASCLILTHTHTHAHTLVESPHSI